MTPKKSGRPDRMSWGPWWVGTCTLLLQACAGAPPKPVRFVEARPLKTASSLRTNAPDRRLVTSTRELAPLAGGAPTPLAVRPSPPPGDPLKLPEAPAIPVPVAAGDYTAVIAAANQSATQEPDPDSYLNAIQQYVYTPGTVYRVYAGFRRVVDVALKTGERMVGDPVLGEKERWATVQGKSKDDRGEQQHVYFRPLFKSQTNVVINTDAGRSYYLELHTTAPESGMQAVSWLYPADEWAAVAEQVDADSERENSATEGIDPDKINAHYFVDVIEGTPRWKPTLVFDDGTKTYIQFPPQMSRREAPALFVWRDGETQMVNFRPRLPKDDEASGVYEVDRLFDVAELRVGQEHQEIVRIERTQ